MIERVIKYVISLRSSSSNVGPDINKKVGDIIDSFMFEPNDEITRREMGQKILDCYKEKGNFSISDVTGPNHVAQGIIQFMVDYVLR